MSARGHTDVACRTGSNQHGRVNGQTDKWLARLDVDLWTAKSSLTSRHPNRLCPVETQLMISSSSSFSSLMLYVVRLYHDETQLMDFFFFQSHVVARLCQDKTQLLDFFLLLLSFFSASCCSMRFSFPCYHCFVQSCTRLYRTQSLQTPLPDPACCRKRHVLEPINLPWAPNTGTRINR